MHASSRLRGSMAWSLQAGVRRVTHVCMLRAHPSVRRALAHKWAVVEDAATHATGALEGPGRLRSEARDAHPLVGARIIKIIITRVLGDSPMHLLNESWLGENTSADISSP